MSTNENSTTKAPAWKEAGLPGCPVFLVPPHKVYFAPLDALITDDTGKIITASSDSGLDSILSESLRKSIEAIKLMPELAGGVLGTVNNQYLDIVAFQYTGSGRLSLLERHTAGVLARMAEKYYPPMKRRDRTVFPSALEDLPKELQSPRLNVQQWKIFTQDKAIQVAAVLEAMWPDVKTTVFEDGDGWFVAVDAGEYEFEGMETLERVETVLWMLSDFDVVPNEYSMGTLAAGLSAEDYQEERKRLDEKAVRTFDAYTAQQHIEDGINAILAHLGHPIADSIATDAELVSNIESAARDRHTRQAKPKSKATSKRSA